jgi:hypothetical protein
MTVAATARPTPLVRKAQFAATWAITVDAPPGAVRPWLVPMGCLRPGWCSNDLLDNLAYPERQVGVAALDGGGEPDPASHPDSARTRQPRHPVAALGAVVLLEFGDFAMCRRMLRGVKARAERPPA